MEKILVPIDFSKESFHALDLAYQIARKTDENKMILLNVIEHPSGSTFSAMGGGLPTHMSDNLYILQLLKRVKTDLQAIMDDPQYAGTDITYDIKIGNPYKGISETIIEHEADLVIMGTTGASGFDEVFIGSNAEKVVRYAKCPVITVRNKVNITDIGDIVFASSFKGDASDYIDRLKKLQKRFLAKLHLVKINTPNNFERDRVNMQLLENYAKKYDLENYETHTYNDITEEDGIISFAEEINADMIAMTTHGRTGLAHLISGSIAEDVINHAKRPMWTFHHR